MRKNYLDNIRWFIILLVVIFHVFFYFNNIGVSPVFSGLPEYHAGDSFRIESVFEYAVYPWFMVLLFIVAGMSAFYALKKKTPSEFIKGRARKLLIPSFIGVLCFGWISGSIVVTQSMKNSGAGDLANMPGFVRFIIYTFSGTGALWFCQVLFVASVLLLLIRNLDLKINKDEKFLVNGNILTPIALVFVYFIFWGSSKILNTPVVTSYRFGIYLLSFLLGYYFFSQERAVVLVKKLRFVSTFFAIVTGWYFIKNAYGTYYADINLLSSWYTNLFVYFSVLAILGLFSAYFDKANSFTKFCSQESFSVYVIHITVLVLCLKLLDFTNLPVWGKYCISFVGGLGITLGLGLVIKRIPVLRYVILGIRKNNPQKKDLSLEQK